MPNLKFLASTDPEIWRGFQNSKSRSRDLLFEISRERLKLETSNLAHRLATGGPNEKIQN